MVVDEEEKTNESSFLFRNSKLAKSNPFLVTRTLGGIGDGGDPSRLLDQATASSIHLGSAIISA